MRIAEFIKQRRSYEEIHYEADCQLGILGKKNKSLTKEQHEQWWLVFEYLDFHANGTPPTQIH